MILNNNKMVILTEDNFHVVLSEIVENSTNVESAIKKITKLKYPNTNNYIEDIHARAFYAKFIQINNLVNQKIKLDKNFTENCYKERSQLYKDIYMKKKININVNNFLYERKYYYF